MVVVLPTPFTPAIMITKGLCPVVTSGRSNGCSSSVSASCKAVLSCFESSSASRLTRVRSDSSNRFVAWIPVSAVNKAVSSSSYRSSSIFLPPNNPDNCLPNCCRVRVRPCLILSAKLTDSTSIRAGFFSSEFFLDLKMLNILVGCFCFGETNIIPSTNCRGNVSHPPQASSTFSTI